MPPRMTANPLKPARYRAGKPTGNESSSDSDASDNEHPQDKDEPSPAAPIPPPPKAASAKKIANNLGKLDLEARRRADAAAEAQRVAIKEEERRAAEEGFVTEEEEDDDEDEDGEEDESGEEDSSSSEEEEEEAPRRIMMRPKFIPKNQRTAAAAAGAAAAPAADGPSEEEARRRAADELVEEQIRKDLAARAAGKKHWDDEDKEESDVDTTDGLDPAAEEAAWRVRELKRLRRARTAIEERERELAEVERRRNLTEEERRAEDEAYLAQQQEDRDAKGKMGYMQRYFHKGAFFQDEAAAAGLLQRDIMGGRIQDDVRNREALPEFLQKRDMTKLGRKGASKYKDMRSEDTGRWGSFDHRGRRPGDDNGDDRFRPDDDRFRPDDERGVKGANAIPLGERSRGRRYSRSRSRSRSPRRDGEDFRSRRKRSSTRDRVDRHEDKRRRVDAR